MATKRPGRRRTGVQPGTGEHPDGPERSVTRRAIIQVGLLAGAAAGLTVRSGLPNPLTVLGWSGVQVAPPVLLTRREDQLALRFEFVNLVLRKVGEPGPGDPSTARLVREVPGQPAYVIVHFGPQALGEYAYDESNNPTYGTPVKAVVSGPSRLAFLVPAATGVIPYTLADLLAWHELSQSVVPTAVQAVQGKPVPVAPLVTQTSIEAPWRVLLSPHDGAGWAHTVALSQVTHGGRTELWHTRLGTRTAGGVDESAPRTVRAVWTPGFNRAVPPTGPDPDPPGSTSMTALNRWEAVRLTSDWAIINRGTAYLPEPLHVDRLMLSAHGASVHMDGDWPGVHDDQQSYTFALRSWVHRADLGRDSFVQVVEGGYLCGLGHRAATVTVVERKFKTISEPGHPQFGKPVAVLTKRRFIAVGESEREYPAPPGPGPNPGKQPHEGRAMPFKKVRIVTRITPDLVDPVDPNNPNQPATRVPKDPADPDGECYGAQAYWPRVQTGPSTSVDFEFTVVATDAEGNECHLRMPLIFVRNDISDKQADMTAVLAAYGADPDRVTSDAAGQQVAFATFPDGDPGECAYPTAGLTFGASLPEPANGGLDVFQQPRFFPELRSARVRLDAVERVAGQAMPAQSISLHDAWLTDPDHQARLFATLDTPVDLGFGADASGGVATPDMRITGLSARTGPIGGDLSTPQPPVEFDPSDFFGGASPRILGAIALTDVIGTGDFDGTAKAPRMVTTPVADGVETKLVWRPAVEGDDGGVFIPGGNASLELTASTLVRHDGSAPTSKVSGVLTDFAVQAVGDALPLAIVHFDRMSFTSTDGGKPDVRPEIGSVEFLGILKFVEKLQNCLSSVNQANGAQGIQSGGQGSSGAVEVTASGIKVSYLLTLPTIAVGVFSLENISIGSSLAIPFDGQPARVRFTFAERESPFMLTVSMFGGGGFVGVAFGLDQFELFEAALEFGAKLALDIGVASGGVSAVAGIYLAIGDSEGELTGYLRLNGELEVIGLVHLAIEFYLGFTYDLGTKEVYGEASVTVSIDVLLFSGSVTLGPVRKRFAGGAGTSGAQALGKPALVALTGTAAALGAPGSPTFADLVGQPDWVDYCALYAPAAFA